MPQSSPTGELHDVVQELRRAFHGLKALVDVLHEQGGVTAPMRAVLETLADDGPQTVPQIARARPTSRQYIQRVVDELLAAGLVRTTPNDQHKRSPLIAPTRAGVEAFAEVRTRELAPMVGLAEGIDPAELVQAASVLRILADRSRAMLAESGAPAAGVAR